MNENIHHDMEHCKQESRITKVEQNVSTLFHNNDRMEDILDRLEETQSQLSISVAELANTFKVLKVIGGILVALFSGVVVFLIVELIKIIH